MSVSSPESRPLATAVSLAILAAAAAYLFLPRPGQISAGDAHELVRHGAWLVDVRTPEEFAAGHVEGARNIPVQELDRRMDELMPRSRPLVVYCRSGHRSHDAKQALVAAGFTAVHDLGGMSRW